MMLVSGVLQLVGDVAHELALEAVGQHQRLVALDQRALVALGIGHVDEGDERGPVRQRRDREVDDALVRPRHLPLDRLAPVGDAGDGVADARPGGAVVVELAALGDDLVDVRPLVERAARQPPDLRQRRVVQLEAAVGLEHRHAFLEAVEGLALRIDEGVVAALQREPLGHVVVEIGERRRRGAARR